MKSRQVLTCGLAVMVIFASGCASDRVGAEFGSSVRNMVKQQTYDNAVDSGATPMLDGGRAEGVVQTYRTSEPQAVPVSLTTGVLK